MFLRTNPNVPTIPFGYYAFTGIDTTRPVAAMETGEGQALIALNNAHADYRGQLRVDGGGDKIEGDYPVIHIRHFAFGEVCYVESLDGYVQLNSTRGHSQADAFLPNTPVTSTVFNRRVYVFGFGQVPWGYDGYVWRNVQSNHLRKLRPAFGVAGMRRLIVAGCVGYDTTLFFSRVDDEGVFPDEEDPKSLSVLSAGRLDIGNLLGTADWITGLAIFEQSKLCIFTNDRTLVYQIDPDLNQWQLDDRSSIHVGCVSHNTVQEAENDILFCSRYGVHSVRRSDRNGIMVYSFEMSKNIEDIYRSLYSQVTNPSDISAVWSQDESQYHIFFPTGQGNFRLTMTLPNRADGEEAPMPRWSTGDFLNAQCGGSLSGVMHWGTPAGIWRMRGPKETAEHYPTARVVTPILWHSDFQVFKTSMSLILQAMGSGDIKVVARDEYGTRLWSEHVNIEPAEVLDDRVGDIPLNQSYQVAMPLRYRGVQLEMEIKSQGDVTLAGFAVEVQPFESSAPNRRKER